MRRLIVGLILLCFAGAASALKNIAPNEVSLDGQWTVNLSASDDAEKLLAQRIQEEMREQRRFEERRRRRMQNDPFAWEPEMMQFDSPQRRAAMEERDRAMRQMLGMTKSLSIKQTEGGAKLQIVSEFESRRLTAGSRSQISMPQGQLADLESGWERDVFVIERRTRDGPRVMERYRRIKNSNQLELVVTVKGDSMLAGMRIRRVFELSAEAPAPTNPSVGPGR